MTLELACELAIAIGLLTHSGLLVRQSLYLAEWLNALMRREAALCRFLEELQEHRPDDAPPDARPRAEHNGE